MTKSEYGCETETCPAPICNMWGGPRERNYTEKDHPHAIRRELYANNEHRRRMVDGAEQNIAGVKASVELGLAQLDMLLEPLERSASTDEAATGALQVVRQMLRFYIEEQAAEFQRVMEHMIDHDCTPIEYSIERGKRELQEAQERDEFFKQHFASLPRNRSLWARIREALHWA